MGKHVVRDINQVTSQKTARVQDTEEKLVKSPGVALMGNRCRSSRALIVIQGHATKTTIPITLDINYKGKGKKWEIN